MPEILSGHAVARAAGISGEGNDVIEILTAETADHYRDAADLFRRYGEIPGIEVCLRSLDQEVESLPGDYAPPGGALLLAYRDGGAVGCVGIRRIEEGVCEMRRLFLRPEARGGKTGRRLAEAALEEAVRLGYRAMRLETLPEIMKPALALYRSLGFTEIEPYGECPPSEALHLERRLP